MASQTEALDSASASRGEGRQAVVMIDGGVLHGIYTKFQLSHQSQSSMATHVQSSNTTACLSSSSSC